MHFHAFSTMIRARCLISDQSNSSKNEFLVSLNGIFSYATFWDEYFKKENRPNETFLSFHFQNESILAQCFWTPSDQNCFKIFICSSLNLKLFSINSIIWKNVAYNVGNSFDSATELFTCPQDSFDSGYAAAWSNDSTGEYN